MERGNNGEEIDTKKVMPSNAGLKPSKDRRAAGGAFAGLLRARDFYPLKSCVSTPSFVLGPRLRQAVGASPRRGLLNRRLSATNIQVSGASPLSPAFEATYHSYPKVQKK